ncbi:hypothetical protein L227DRAFT_574866 [Lentinus tigrinus ALCF2SS1-6]|uniref:Acid protease n=1 Tax=Lentinus tigrinus ALCF2SS1-6 TaxID=1328759 RepID=A0A5C2SC29_9APHY|nr:hypothetical protein L227DRAFT_574866 [Lentinus tigrinus ALCF2SS1-6]
MSTQSPSSSPDPDEMIIFELISPEAASPLDRRNADIVFRFGVIEFLTSSASGDISASPPVSLSEATTSGSGVPGGQTASTTSVISNTPTRSEVGTGPELIPDKSATRPGGHWGRRPTPEPGRRTPHALMPVGDSGNKDVDISRYFSSTEAVREPPRGNWMSLAHESNTVDVTEQTYRIQLKIQDRIFEPLIDTVSNASWLRGAGGKCFAWKSATGELKEVTEEDLNRHTTETPPEHAVLEGYNQYYPNATHARDVLHGIINYGDTSIVWFGLGYQQEKLACVFPNCFTFTASEYRPHPITKKLSLGFAYGWSSLWALRLADGVLSLGLLDHYSQQHFSSLDKPMVPRATQSIIEALRGRLVRAQHGGFSLYFALYATWNEDEHRKSWMSINGWPKHESVYWSSSIPVVTSANNEHWVVNLLSFRIAYGRNPPPHPDGRPAATIFDDIPGTEFLFNDGSGIHVVLDTGASTSWFPLSFVSHLRTTIFPSEYNLQLEEVWADKIPSFGTPTPPYRLLPDDTFEGPAYHHDPAAIVILKFVGSEGPVEVHCPIYDFLVGAANPVPRNNTTTERLGLFHAAPPSLKGRGILGLNFFQSVYVALHKERGQPYVRLANRFSGSKPNLLPPMRS